MTPQESRLSRRLKIAGTCICSGLVVEAVTLYSMKSLSFLAFACVGGTLVGIGIGVFLYSLVTD